MSTSSPFLLFFNTLSDRLVRNGTAFFDPANDIDPVAAHRSHVRGRKNLNKIICCCRPNNNSCYKKKKR